MGGKSLNLKMPHHSSEIFTGEMVFCKFSIKIIWGGVWGGNGNVDEV